ncbi:HDOD domain-containing protein [Salinicola avicenniae]|uniref:HDOD domain-containing protein n=1 Tax=Salinicola avicenniae TaxID=2916836 RepID=UPI0020732A0E|nr:MULTISPECIES: HDOD domain-containing protein [unclassified Salinicola]
MSLDSLFEHIHQLPSVPAVVAELMASLDNDKISVHRVSATIRKDPSLSLKLLRSANSVRYGVGRNVSSIDDALLLLGFDRVRTLVIASGMVGMLKDVPGLDREAFWKESFMVANLSRTIVRHSHLERLSPETAFTCGILHHVGSALMHIAEPEVMQRIDTLVDQGAPRDELEANQFGYTFSEVGAALGRRWRFPETICNALTFQERPLEAVPFSPYAAAVHLAIGLYQKIANGRREEHALGEMPKAVRRPLALDLLALYEEILENVRADDELDIFLS